MNNSSILYSTVLDPKKPTVPHYHESAKVINGYQASILSREPSLKSEHQQKTVQHAQSDPSRSAVAELRRLSTLSGKKDLSDLSIPTITENAEDVAGKLLSESLGDQLTLFDQR